MRAPCSIPGCEKPSAGRTWCSTHWLRWRKYGDPLYVTPRAEWKVNKRTGCLVEGCDSKHHAHGYCARHAYRFTTYGDPLAASRIPTGRPLAGERPGYDAIHRRLARTCGPARSRSCVECGAPADEWSYDGDDPNQYQAPAKSPRGWLWVTENLDAYSPRCVSCHRRLDDSLDRERDDQGRWAS